MKQKLLTAINPYAGSLIHSAVTILISGFLLAGANRAAAAVVVTLQESNGGLVVTFVGTVTGAAGAATTSASLSATGALGYNLRYDSRRTESSFQVGFSGQVQAPYYEAKRLSTWSFLTPQSMQGVVMGSAAAQMTAGSLDNTVLVFATKASPTAQSTEISLLSNSQNMVIDRTYTLPGVSFATLNLAPSIEYDTDYQLSGGDTLRFVNPIPEPSTSLLGLLGTALLFRRRRVA